MPLEIFFVMLIEEVVPPFALGIQCFHENEKKQQSILVVVFSGRNMGNQLFNGIISTNEFFRELVRRGHE